MSDLLDGFTRGMDWIGRTFGLDGLAIVVMAWVGLLVWRLS